MLYRAKFAVLYEIDTNLTNTVDGQSTIFNDKTGGS